MQIKKYKIPQNNVLRIWDKNGEVHTFHYNKGDEDKFIEAGYKQYRDYDYRIA